MFTLILLMLWYFSLRLFEVLQHTHPFFAFLLVSSRTIRIMQNLSEWALAYHPMIFSTALWSLSWNSKTLLFFFLIFCFWRLISLCFIVFAQVHFAPCFWSRQHRLWLCWHRCRYCWTAFLLFEQFTYSWIRRRPISCFSLHCSWLLCSPWWCRLCWSVRRSPFRRRSWECSWLLFYSSL